MSHDQEPAMPLYREASIRPADSGFGEYVVGEYAEPYLLSEIMDGAREEGDVVDLKDGATLPACVEDIRGRIRDEPSRVFAVVCGERVTYFGVVKWMGVK